MTLSAFATFVYTLDDKLKTIYGNGEVGTYSYDTRSRPSRILVMSGSTKRLDLNYTYDGASNVKTINTETYGYDFLDGLTSSTDPWGTITYSYDGVGNRFSIKVGSTTTAYSYGSFNRLNSAGSTSFTYDASGNQATKNDGTYSWTYTYDFENRLTKVVRSGTTAGVIEPTTNISLCNQMPATTLETFSSLTLSTFGSPPIIHYSPQYGHCGTGASWGTGYTSATLKWKDT